MVAKRALDFSTPAGVQQMNKRLKRVERIQRARKPEMKTATYPISAGTIASGVLSTTQITSINQGDSGSERVGDKIRVFRVEVRGTCGAELDTYILQKHGQDNPVAGDFNSTTGAFLVDTIANKKYTEWAHCVNYGIAYNDQPRFRRVVSFKNGMIVRFNGATATPVDNGLLFCALNRSSTTHSIDATCRIWYTDV